MATRAGPIEGIKVDIKRLHETWMELLFPRQRGAEDTVFGKWKPSTTAEAIGYKTWSLLGMAALVVLYPLALFGRMTRFYVRRIDWAVARIGLLGVVVLTAVVWGGLTVVSWFRFSQEGFLAVAAAAAVATLSAVLAVGFARIDGRATTVVFSYPLGVTAVTLPPVVAAFFSPTLAAYVFPGSETISVWFLENVFETIGIADRIRSTFDLEGIAYLGMWVAISAPVGWFVGLLVTLANLVRPTDE